MREKRNKKNTSYGAIQKGVIYWVTQNYWQEVDIRANYFHLLDEESFGMQRLAETVSNAMREQELVTPSQEGKDEECECSTRTMTDTACLLARCFSMIGNKDG